MPCTCNSQCRDQVQFISKQKPILRQSLPGSARNFFEFLVVVHTRFSSSKVKRNPAGHPRASELAWKTSRMSKGFATSLQIRTARKPLTLTLCSRCSSDIYAMFFAWKQTALDGWKHGFDRRMDMQLLQNRIATHTKAQSWTPMADLLWSVSASTSKRAQLHLHQIQAGKTSKHLKLLNISGERACHKGLDIRQPGIQKVGKDSVYREKNTSLHRCHSGTSTSWKSSKQI